MSKSLSHQFLDFCREKPADEAYNYSSIDDCAFCQFLRAVGYPVQTVGPDYWRDTAGAIHEFSTQIQNAVVWVDTDLPNCGRTFGALTTRLEAALAEQVS